MQESKQEVTKVVSFVKKNEGKNVEVYITNCSNYHKNSKYLDRCS